MQTVQFGHKYTAWLGVVLVQHAQIYCANSPGEGWGGG